MVYIVAFRGHVCFFLLESEWVLIGSFNHSLSILFHGLIHMCGARTRNAFDRRTYLYLFLPRHLFHLLRKKRREETGEIAEVCVWPSAVGTSSVKGNCAGRAAPVL